MAIKQVFNNFAAGMYDPSLEENPGNPKVANGARELANMTFSADGYLVPRPTVTVHSTQLGKKSTSLERFSIDYVSSAMLFYDTDNSYYTGPNYGSANYVVNIKSSTKDYAFGIALGSTSSYSPANPGFCSVYKIGSGSFVLAGTSAAPECQAFDTTGSTVYLKGESVLHSGSYYTALIETDNTPPHADWASATLPTLVEASFVTTRNGRVVVATSSGIYFSAISRFTDFFVSPLPDGAQFIALQDFIYQLDDYGDAMIAIGLRGIYLIQDTFPNYVVKTYRINPSFRYVSTPGGLYALGIGRVDAVTLLENGQKEQKTIVSGIGSISQTGCVVNLATNDIFWSSGVEGYIGHAFNYITNTYYRISDLNYITFDLTRNGKYTVYKHSTNGLITLAYSTGVALDLAGVFSVTPPTSSGGTLVLSAKFASKGVFLKKGTGLSRSDYGVFTADVSGNVVLSAGDMVTHPTWIGATQFFAGLSFTKGLVTSPFGKGFGVSASLKKLFVAVDNAQEPITAQLMNNDAPAAETKYVGAIETDVLTITGGPISAVGAAGVDIVLNGAAAVSISLANGDTASQVATKIAAGSFGLWDAVASGATVTFTKYSYGSAAGAFTATFTGDAAGDAVGTFAETVVGYADLATWPSGIIAIQPSGYFHGTFEFFVNSAYSLPGEGIAVKITTTTGHFIKILGVGADLEVGEE